jgi:hypothetical protein
MTIRFKDADGRVIQTITDIPPLGTVTRRFAL